MINWKDVVVDGGLAVREGIAVIDQGGLQIALVVDEAGVLLGTVTDGDVRRGILRGAGLDAPLREIMNSSPATCRPGGDREALIELMQTRCIHHIPVVDESGVLQGLEMLRELMRHETRDNPVLLMAGGLGQRLRPLTESCPKPMIRVGGRPILETIIAGFRKQGFHNFYVSVNYKSEVIENHFGDGSAFGVSIRYVRESERMGTAGALGLLPERPDMPLLMMNGDVLTTVDFGALLDFHQTRDCEATMCVRRFEYQIPYGVVESDGEVLRGIVEKPVSTCFINAGIYVVEPEALGLVPRGEYHDMTDLLPRIQARGGKVGVYPVHEYWLDVGRKGDLERAECEYRELFE